MAISRALVTAQQSLSLNEKSLYSWRLLELLLRERDRGPLLNTLEDFRNVFEIPDTYRIADIKRRVIEMAMNELNSKADLAISWKPMKLGRAVNSLDF